MQIPEPHEVYDCQYEVSNFRREYQEELKLINILQKSFAVTYHSSTILRHFVLFSCLFELFDSSLCCYRPVYSIHGTECSSMASHTRFRMTE